MRSERSCYKWTVFKKTVGRFWPIWGSYLIIWFVVLPLNGLMQLQQPGWTNGMTEFEWFAKHLVAACSDWAMEISVVFGVMAAMAAFSHLYSSRSADFYGALPIRRESLFSIQYLAGLVFLIIPNLIIFGLTLLVEAAGGAVEMEPLLHWMGVACGTGFFFYSMAVLIAMLVGHILAVPAFFFIGNVLVAGVYYILQMVLKELYYGFPTAWQSSDVVIWFTPINLLNKVWINVDTVYQEDGSVQWVFHSAGMGYVAAYAGVAVLMAVAALLLYRTRRLESAGDLVAVKALRPVFKYAVALLGGLVFGTATAQNLPGGRAVLMGAILVWGVVGCFAAQMMLDKSFKVLRKWKGPAAVAAVFLLLILVVKFDLTGYETRVPDSGKVSAVLVTDLYSPMAGNAAHYTNFVDLEITEQEQIDNVLILHRWALEHRVEDAQYVQTPNEAFALNLTYQLSGGGTMSRSYAVEVNPADMGREGSPAWALEQIYADRTLYWKALNFDQIQAFVENNGYLNVCYQEDDSSFYQDFYEQDAAALLEAVKLDFQAGDIGRPSLDYWSYQREQPSKSLSFYARDSREWLYGDGYVVTELPVPDTAVNTLCALEQRRSEGTRYLDTEAG